MPPSSPSPRRYRRAPVRGQSPSASPSFAVSSTHKRRRPHDDSATDNKALLLIASTLFAAALVLATFEYFTALRSTGTRLGVLAIFTVTMAFVVAHKAQEWVGFPNSSLLATTFLFVDFTAALDTILTLGLLDSVTQFGRWYVNLGEEYFKSTSGFYIIGWDGTFHVVLQSYVTFCILTGRTYKYAALICMGSVLSSMAPLLVGAVSSDEFSHRIQLCTALNPPYVVLPLAIIIHCLRIKKSGRNEQVAKIANMKLLDAILAVYHLSCIVWHMIRSLVVMKSKSGLALWWSTNVEPSLVQDKHLHVTVQCMEWLFWYVPFHMAALHDLLVKNNFGTTERTRQSLLLFGSHGAGLAALVLGGYLQGVGLHMWTSTMTWHNFTLTLQEVQPSMLFWVVNISTIAGAMLQFVSDLQDDE